MLAMLLLATAMFGTECCAAAVTSPLLLAHLAPAVPLHPAAPSAAVRGRVCPPHCAYQHMACHVGGLHMHGSVHYSGINLLLAERGYPALLSLQGVVLAVVHG